MNPHECHVIYVNRKVTSDRLLYAKTPGHNDEDNEIRGQIQPLLNTFGDGKFATFLISLLFSFLLFSFLFIYSRKQSLQSSTYGLALVAQY